MNDLIGYHGIAIQVLTDHRGIILDTLIGKEKHQNKILSECFFFDFANAGKVICLSFGLGYPAGRHDAWILRKSILLKRLQRERFFPKVNVKRGNGGCNFSQ